MYLDDSRLTQPDDELMPDEGLITLGININSELYSRLSTVATRQRITHDDLVTIAINLLLDGAEIELSELNAAAIDQWRQQNCPDRTTSDCVNLALTRYFLNREDWRLNEGGAIDG